MKRSGFTIIELVVVILIVATVAALLVPTMQQLRERARLAQCSSNLKRIGLALHNYHDAHGALPPGVLNVNYLDPRSNEASPLAMLLPFFEHASSFAVFDFGHDANLDPANLRARQQVVPELQCPSQPVRAPFVVSQCPFGCGTTNYHPSLGANANYAKNNGPFGKRYGASFSEFSDGLGYTALFSESMLGPSAGVPSIAVTAAGSPDDFAVATTLDYATFDSTPGGGELYWNPACDDRRATAFQYRGKQYYRGGVYSTFYSHTLPPNSRHRDCIRGEGLDQGHLAARSYHLGGVNYVLGDGSVRFASNEIAPDVWRALGSKAGGESLVDF